MRQENIPLVIMSSNSWVDDCLKKFEADCKKYKMGRSFLYDGGKYFHCAISDLNTFKLNSLNVLSLILPHLHFPYNLYDFHYAHELFDFPESILLRLQNQHLLFCRLYVILLCLLHL